MTKSILMDELRRDEGDRPEIYDDHNGRTVNPGNVVYGLLTLGSGITGPFDDVEREFLLSRRVDRAHTGLCRALPWFPFLDDVRQRALVNMAFNLGVAGLIEWPHMLGFLESGDFEKAAAEIDKSEWMKEVGDRARRISAMIRAGIATLE